MACALPMKPPPIMATYMARRPPAFVRNLADARYINIAHGIYPPLLVSGGLARALPAAAAHAAVPVQLNLHQLGRYPAPIEAAVSNDGQPS